MADEAPQKDSCQVPSNPACVCKTCRRPLEIKTDKPGVLSGEKRGTRIRPLTTKARHGRKKKRDPRDVKFY